MTVGGKTKHDWQVCCSRSSEAHVCLQTRHSDKSTQKCLSQQHSGYDIGRPLKTRIAVAEHGQRTVSAVHALGCMKVAQLHIAFGVLNVAGV